MHRMGPIRQAAVRAAGVVRGRVPRAVRQYLRQPRPAATVGDVGMATAEYAIATLAACGFAGLLLTILRSGEVKGMLVGIVRRALSV